MDFSADCTILTAMISRVQSYEKLQKSFRGVLHDLENDTLTCNLLSPLDTHNLAHRSLAVAFPSVCSSNSRIKFALALVVQQGKDAV